MNFVVGLTGGIGSGKTTVAEYFRQRDAAIVDCDEIARELTASAGAAMPAIIREFGSLVAQADGGLDRGLMRQLCFTDPTARRRLEAILHPMIRREADARCRQAATVAPYVLLVVPLLIESGMYRERIDRLLVIDCDETVQVERVMRRSGLSEHEVRAIMATQTSRGERLGAADDVIVNNGGEDLGVQVEALHRRYLEMARILRP